MRKEWTKEYPGAKVVISGNYISIYFLSVLLIVRGNFHWGDHYQSQCCLVCSPPKRKNKNSSFIVQIRQLSSKCWNFGFLFSVCQCWYSTIISLSKMWYFRNIWYSTLPGGTWFTSDSTLVWSCSYVVCVTWSKEIKISSLTKQQFSFSISFSIIFKAIWWYCASRCSLHKSPSQVCSSKTWRDYNECCPLWPK